MIHLFTLSHWLKGLAVSFHSISSMDMRICCLSVLFLLTFYFLLNFTFLLFLLLTMTDRDSMNYPLCHSAIGSFVTLDDCMPDTVQKCASDGSGTGPRRTARRPHVPNAGFFSWFVVLSMSYFCASVGGPPRAHSWCGLETYIR